MRIAQCLEAPLFNPGGVEVLVLELIRELNAHQIELLLVLPQELTKEQRKALPGVKEIFLWDHSVPAVKESHRLANWLRNHKVDLTHFHLGGSYGWNARSWKGCPISHVSRAGTPCVTTNHGAFTIFDCVAPYRPLWLKILSLPPFWISKLHQLRHVHWEATVSSHDLQAVRRWFFPARKKFLQLYHSKLHGDEFSTPCNTWNHSIPQLPFILCLGTIGARKGQQYLVEAFLSIAVRYPNWKLVLAGRQAHEPTLRIIKDQIASSNAGNRVIMMPDVNDATAKTLLQRAAIFAIPSTGEGLGLSLQEAMYAGCACIGSRVGGIPDLIENEITGLLVPPAQPSDLAEGLARLMAEELLRKRLSEAAKASMLERKMTALNMTQTYLKLYEKVLGGKSLY